MSVARVLIVGALALCACRSDRNDTDDARSTNPESFSTSDPYSNRDSRTPREASSPRTTTSGSATNQMLSAMDRDFVMQAANAGMFEVHSSQLALQKGVSGKDREFAEMMIQDHERANRELERIARDKGTTMPRDMDTQHENMLADLRNLEGEPFARRYRELQMQGHERAIALFERASRECQDQELKAYAQRTLPKLRQHAQHLTDMGVSSQGSTQKDVERNDG